MANPFRLEGEWLKAQFHAHSLNSDGEVPPDELASAYARHGFDVLTISDHWTMTKIDAPAGLLLESVALTGASSCTPSIDIGRSADQWIGA